MSYQPDFVFHLAAQSLVKKSYLNPIETFQSNIIGTVNILEALRQIKKKVNVVVITSDKSYKNLELSRGYKEEDLLGGNDPYSASKGSAEFVIQSYIKSFFFKKNNNIFICVARAGNVIGGGDWSNDRLIPDCIKSYAKNKTVLIRNPNSTRPWQHVLEVIYGYLKLASKLNFKKRYMARYLILGHQKILILQFYRFYQKLKKNLPNFKWKVHKARSNFFESKLLKLDSNKAKIKLGWKSILSISESTSLVANWYNFFYKSKKKNIDLYNLSVSQINFYLKKLKKMKVVILAGGLGTRMSEITKTIPKPMVKILNKPILIHIMEHYYKYGFKEFYIALGYKGKVIKNFLKEKNLNGRLI